MSDAIVAVAGLALIICLFIVLVATHIWDKENNQPSMWKLIKSKPKNSKRNK